MLKRLLLIFFLAFCVGYTFADVPSRDSEFKMPPEIASTNNAQNIVKYLNSPDQTIRLAAVKRLGEIKNPDSVTLVMQFYNNEPYRKGMELPHGVKREAMLALGEIGNTQARTKLVDVLEDTITSGPALRLYKNDRRDINYDAEYRQIITGALQALSQFDDNETLNAIMATFQNSNLHWYTRQYAYRMKLEREIRIKAISDLADKVKYLTDLLTGSGTGEDAWAADGGKTSEALKNGAIQDLLVTLGPEAIPYLEKTVTNILQIRSAKSKRIHAINETISSIEMIEKSRAK
jgi:HEAT repeat protein